MRFRWRRRSPSNPNAAGGTAFGDEVAAACAWLHRREVKVDGVVGGRWGWMQDVPSEYQNTAEVLVGLNAAAQLDEATFTRAFEYLRESLTDPKCNVRDHGWVSLALRQLAPRGGAEAELLRKELNDWLACQQNDDGGWGTRKDELSQVPTTALTVQALRGTHPERRRRGIEWLVDAQHKDGSWALVGRESAGTTDPSGETAHLDERAQRVIRRTRTEPNAACTAFGVIALLDDAPEDHDARLQKAARWLLRNRIQRRGDDASTGGWMIFRERGIRANQWYTFRHFSTAWALIALTRLRGGEFATTREALEALDYMLGLQDPLVRSDNVIQQGGGWRTAPDGDPYTWSTVNAIMTLTELGPYIDPPGGKRTVGVLLEEMRQRHLRVAFLHTFGPHRIVANAHTALAVAIPITLVSGLWIWAEVRAGDPRWLVFVLATVAIVIVAVPWSALVALYRHPEDPRFGAWLGAAIGVIGLIATVLGTALFAVPAVVTHSAPPRTVTVTVGSPASKRPSIP
jgi:hypothetical protein